MWNRKKCPIKRDNLHLNPEEYNTGVTLSQRTLTFVISGRHLYSSGGGACIELLQSDDEFVRTYTFEVNL